MIFEQFPLPSYGFKARISPHVVLCAFWHQLISILLLMCQCLIAASNHASPDMGRLGSATIQSSLSLVLDRNTNSLLDVPTYNPDLRSCLRLWPPTLSTYTYNTMPHEQLRVKLSSHAVDFKTEVLEEMIPKDLLPYRIKGGYMTTKFEDIDGAADAHIEACREYLGVRSSIQ